MKNIKDIKQKKKIGQRMTVKYYKQRTILDTISFFIIILALSMSLIFISFLQNDNNIYYEKYNDSEEYLKQSILTILDSTIPEVIYIDSLGINEKFIDRSIEELLLLDLSIRYEDQNLNTTNLKLGLEQNVKEVISEFLTDGDRYALTVEFEKNNEDKNTNDNSKVIISSQENFDQLDSRNSPYFEKQLSISGTFQPMVDNIVLIKLFLFN